MPASTSLSVPAPKHWALKCHTCNLVTSSVIATSRDEILVPDFEQLHDQLGHSNARRFEEFYWEHMGHGLEAIEV